MLKSRPEKNEIKFSVVNKPRMDQDKSTSNPVNGETIGYELMEPDPNYFVNQNVEMFNPWHRRKTYQGPRSLQTKTQKSKTFVKAAKTFNFKGQLVENTIREEVVEEGSDDEDLAVAETYSDYMPSKLKVGKRHPDPVVETASLSSVVPPDIHYTLALPSDIVKIGALSALQLEAITYAAQQHEHFLPDGCRAGFLIGDGAGVGKGRTIAGCIFENFLKGRKKAIWISVSNDLKYDSERDLMDIGAKNIKVYPLNKLKYDNNYSIHISGVEEGVIFSTYSLLGSSSTYKRKVRSRMEQLLDWCGDGFDGVLVFDESHKAKNLIPLGSRKPTKTAMAVVELQKRLPLARVVYASATGASEPRNMAYMTRLGIWGKGTPFPEFSDFINSFEMRGVGAMEIVAMDMKLRGIYIARQLSFLGVTFNIEEIPLSPAFVSTYNESVALWVEMLQYFEDAIALMDVSKSETRNIWSQFWSSHQRFFKYLCIAAKVERTVEITRQAVKMGKCVVIGLQSTGEAATLDNLDEDGELNDFVCTAKTVLQNLVEKQFPAPDRVKINKLLGIHGNCTNGDSNTSGNKRKNVRQAAIATAKKLKLELSSSESSSESSSDCSSSPSFLSIFDTDSNTDETVHSSSSSSNDDDDSNNNKGNLTATDKAYALREKLLEKIESLGENLPPNTLDQLIDELGGPENVAEMTGRKGRVVLGERGNIRYESRWESDCTLETLNLTEKQRFMDGEKVIAIISEAASSGISLQSDRRVRNQRRRVHITLELPWSADRAIQQFGRTHRSNQVNAPEYIFLISDLAGERRFASIVAKRLESLGALTHGDRRATESRDLSRFNIDNKYGRTALESVMKAIMGKEAPIVPPPQDYKGDFFKHVTDALVGVGMVSRIDNVPEKDHNNISRFMNRILGFPVELQNRLFQYFTDTLQAIVNQAKKAGRYDLGILDLGTAGENVHRVKMHTFLRHHATGSAITELHVVQAERGFSWEQAVKTAEELTGDNEGFYLSYQIRNGKQTPILAVCPSNQNTGSKYEVYSIYRPNTGLQLRQETLGEILKRYRKVEASAAMKDWTQQYESSQTTCSHAYWNGKCKKVTMGVGCDVGLRRRKYNVLSGSVLSVWTKVEAILRHETKMQVVRLRTAEGIKIVGTLIPNYYLESLIQALKEDAEKTDVELF